jgi:DNA-binding transcriptional ArsR family regulator
MDIDSIVRRAAVLSSRTRVLIWCAVGPEGRHPMALAREFDLSPATITYHLNVLKRARLVRVDGWGASRVYSWTSRRWGIVVQTRGESHGEM